jgi:hypothetical protein
MSKEQAKKKLESIKKKLRKSAKKYAGLGDSFDESDNRILGPQDDIAYQKMKKDIKES